MFSRAQPRNLPSSDTLPTHYSPSMHDAPEVYCERAWPEAVEKYDPDAQVAEIPETKRICGLPRQRLYAWALVTTVIVCAVVGGTVGGVLRSKHSHHQNASPADSSPINDSLNGTSATPTPSGTAPAPLQSSTISNPVNPTEISPVKNTGLALAAWFSDTEGADSNSSPNMQLFYQAKSGGLRSRLYAPNSGWSNETIFLNSSCTPKPQTPLAQMNWGPASTRERSLVFINGQGTICDLTTQQGNETMVEGTLEKVGFQAGKLSRITAQFWEDTHTFFYQDPNDNVIQISYNASWPSWKLQKSYNGVTGLYRGSGIASYSYSASDSSSSSSSSTSIVVEGIVGQGQEGETYTSNTTMTALNWKSSQILGSGMVPGGVPLTASTQTALDGSLRNIQLFWVKSGSVNTMVYSNQTTGGSEFSWGDPAVLATGAGDNTTVAAFIWNSGSQGLLYFQDNSGGISEMKMSTPGAWKVTDFKI